MIRNSLEDLRFLRVFSEKAATLFMSFGYKETKIAPIVPFDYAGAGNIQFFSRAGQPLAVLGNTEAFFPYISETALLPERFFMDQTLLNEVDGDIVEEHFLVGTYRQAEISEGIEEFLAISYRLLKKSGFSDLDIYRSASLDMCDGPAYYGVDRQLHLKELPEGMLFAIQRKGISLATCLKQGDDSLTLFINVSEAMAMNNSEMVPDTNLIIYEPKRMTDAKELAESLRLTGQKSLVLKKDAEVPIEIYLAFCEKEPVDILMYLMDNGKVLLCNLITGDRKIVHDSL